MWKLPVTVIVLVLAGCGEGAGGGDETAAVTNASGCRVVDPPATGARTAKRATARLDPAKTYDLTLRTNCGSFTSRLSQFVVVTGNNIGLPPDYAIVGEVSNGLGVVDRIGKLGDPATEQPTETVEIEKATVAGS